MAWDDDEEEDDWETKDEVELAPKKAAGGGQEWSDEEEEEEEDEGEKIKKMREEREKLVQRLAEIDEVLPMETPKESQKKGKQQKKLIKEREEEDRRKAEEALKAEQQVSLQRKIEESDFENAQDMFAAGGGKGGAGEGDSGKFESWPLNSGTKQNEVEEFATYTAAKISKFQGEFLYLALMRKLLQECLKTLEVDKVKELMLVFTKGREDFTVVDLVRYLLRDVDKSMTPEEVTALFGTEQKTEVKKAGPKGVKAKEIAKLTPRQELIKVLLHDMVKELKSDDAGRIIEEGCGVVLTRDQTQKIAAKRAELTNDPNANKKGAARVADHKSMAMYDAFGSGGGDDWGGGGGTRGDDIDFM